MREAYLLCRSSSNASNNVREIEQNLESPLGLCGRMRRTLIRSLRSFLIRLINLANKVIAQELKVIAQDEQHGSRGYLPIVAVHDYLEFLLHRIDPRGRSPFR
jgi:hypothetical protein